MQNIIIHFWISQGWVTSVRLSNLTLLAYLIEIVPIYFKMKWSMSLSIKNKMFNTFCDTHIHSVLSKHFYIKNVPIMSHYFSHVSPRNDSVFYCWQWNYLKILLLGNCEPFVVLMSIIVSRLLSTVSLLLGHKFLSLDCLIDIQKTWLNEHDSFSFKFQNNLKSCRASCNDTLERTKIYVTKVNV